MTRIFIINVGVNASHGKLQSPIFDDGTFEFIQIPERTKSKHYQNYASCPLLPRYRDLPSFTGNHLLSYIPRSFWNWRVHNDPEFEKFTYGDYPTLSPRAANLKKIRVGDYLYFLARLTRWKKEGFSEEVGFYLIGFFEIEDILKEVTKKPPKSMLEKFGSNPHVRRGLANPKLWDRFWVLKGSSNSIRFKQAIPFNKEFADKVMKSSKGEKWLWRKDKTELQTIGSYTRSCRILHKEKEVNSFLKFIDRFSDRDPLSDH